MEIDLLEGWLCVPLPAMAALRYFLAAERVGPAATGSKRRLIQQTRSLVQSAKGLNRPVRN
jgi:hypothetical protein